MTKADAQSGPDDLVEIDLRNAPLAAFLAWLWPGAGHLYQRRYAKGWLFMAVVLSMYFYGLTIGQGHVVYASWTKDDKRWQFFCQLGVGLPALPAVVQAKRVFGDPPRPPLFKGLMAPPQQPVQPEYRDELAEWHERLSYRFELGTLYTMIAGLLNILAICDAYAGPFGATEDKDAKPKRSEEGEA
jgi:hypothetical protein